MYVCRPLHVDAIKLNVHIWKSISDYSHIHGNHIKSLSWHNGILFFACHCFLVFNQPHNNIAYTMIVCLTTECYKWIVVFQMVTFIVKISICMANWYSRYLRLFGKRDRESLALSKVCEMCLCFFPSLWIIIRWFRAQHWKRIKLWPYILGHLPSTFRNSIPNLCDLVAIYLSITFFFGKVLRLLLWRMMMRGAKWALKIVQKQSKQPKMW